MAPARLRKLANNIGLTGAYPPLVVRPHPALVGEYEILDGHQRRDALRLLGHPDALCWVWPCDDATAVQLLATLNRLRGRDDPVKRNVLLGELTALLPNERIAQLLPDSAAAIEKIFMRNRAQASDLVQQFADVAKRPSQGPRLISFSLTPDDAAVIEQALSAAAASLGGAHRRGHALALIARTYLGRES
jgi:ParB-like chromosome segregation protein Spo0J